MAANFDQFTNGLLEKQTFQSYTVYYAYAASGNHDAGASDLDKTHYIISDKPLRFAVGTGGSVAPTPPAGILIENFQLIQLRTPTTGRETIGWAADDGSLARVAICVVYDS